MKKKQNKFILLIFRDTEKNEMKPKIKKHIYKYIYSSQRKEKVTRKEKERKKQHCSTPVCVEYCVITVQQHTFFSIHPIA